MILHNCLRDPELPRYYVSKVIKWEVLLSPWLQSSHSTMRLMSKFILGHCHNSLAAKDKDLLAMDDNDLNLIIDLIQRGSEEPFAADMMGPLVAPFIQLLADVATLTASNPHKGQESLSSLPFELSDICVSDNQFTASIDQDKVSQSGYTLSVCEVLNTIENLMTVESNHRLLHHKEFCPLLLKILANGGYEEKLAVSKLVWSLSHCSAAFQAELNVADSALSLALECQHDDNTELNTLRKCATLTAKVITSPDDGTFESLW